jgi:superfamily II DNA or RNA helicase
MLEADDYASLRDLQSSSNSPKPSISLLRFPFSLKPDQIKAVNSWVENNFRGTILYSTGTGKTEIAFECAQVRANYTQPSDTQSFSTYNTVTIQNYHESSANEDYDNSFKVLKNAESDPSITPIISFFNILFLVPRISLIDQTITRLITYGIPRGKIGAYFGERKETREIMISTYHSIIKNLNLVRRSNMVIFDEVHLIKDTAKSFSKIFDVVVEDPTKAILGLTATLDEKDFKNKTILAVLPPVIRYSINKAVNDKRLAKPIVIPIKVNLTPKEEKEYNLYSSKIKNISNRFKRYDAVSMTDLLKKGGFASGMAKAWFSNIRKRKLLLSCTENKLSAAADIVTKRFPEEKIMVFSETIESIQRLNGILEDQDIKSKIIDAKVKTAARQKILDKWGIDFNVLLSVHTLEIGYDVPAVRIEIILATTSNMNQVIQRIGRVIRKQEGKDVALIYVIYVTDTKDDNIIELVKKALKDDSHIIQTSNRESLEQEYEEKTTSVSDTKARSKKKHKQKQTNDEISIKNDTEGRINKAYRLVESNLRDPIIIEQKQLERKESESSYDGEDKIKTIYKVQSSKEKNKFYEVDVKNKTCTCSDFTFRKIKCKHIIATELILP